MSLPCFLVSLFLKRLRFLVSLFFLRLSPSWMLQNKLYSCMLKRPLNHLLVLSTSQVFKESSTLHHSQVCLKDMSMLTLKMWTLLKESSLQINMWLKEQIIESQRIKRVKREAILILKIWMKKESLKSEETNKQILGVLIQNKRRQRDLLKRLVKILMQRT